MGDIKISLLRVDTRLLQALYACTQGSEGWVDGLVIQITPINTSYGITDLQFQAENFILKHNRQTNTCTLSIFIYYNLFI